MSAKILAFPGITLPNSEDCAAPVPGLSGKQRALVITEERSGFVSVRMRPTCTEAERRCVSHFNTAEEARRFALQLRGQFPALYVRVIDRTGPEEGSAA